MSDTQEPQAKVLIVDDEQGLADLYAAWLADTYEVRTAYDGEQALDKIDDTVDVVLLDRRMPGLSGDDVLTEIRERGCTCHVAMITAVGPDLDIAELRFDDYATKPIKRDELEEVVQILLQRSKYSNDIQRVLSLFAKKYTLEEELGQDELEASEEYQNLQQELTDAQGAADDSLRDLLENDDFTGAFRDYRTDEFHD